MGVLPAFFIHEMFCIVVFISVLLPLLRVELVVARLAYRYKVLICLAVICVCPAECQGWMLTNELNMMYSAEKMLVAFIVYIVSGDDSFLLALGTFVVILLEYLILE